MEKGKWITSELIALAVTSIVALCCDAPSVDAITQQCVVPLMPLIGLGISLASAGASAGIAGAQAKKAKAEQDKAEGRLKDWYSAEMGTDILDRADTMSMLNAYRETMAEQNRKYANNAIKGGASEEAQVAYAQAANKGYADAISKISAQGQQRKEQVADAYMQNMMGIHNQRAEQYLNSGQRMANIVSSLGKGLSSAVGGMDLGSIGKVEGGGIGFIKPKA